MKSRCHEVLKKWAFLAKPLVQAEADWSPIKRITGIGMRLIREEAKSTEELVKRSRKHFNRLGEPLDADFGLHRWLRTAREEAYSAWLAWVLEQFDNAHDIHKIFSMKPPQREYKGPIKCELEEWVEEGHSGHGGKVDILVKIGDRKAMVLEIKIGDADEADTGKQTGYAKSFGKSATKFLVATSGTEHKYKGGFELKTWSNICVQLRGLVPRARMCNMQKTLTLAFVGAVEQNVLGFPSVASQILKHHGPGLSVDMRHHIEKGMVTNAIARRD